MAGILRVLSIMVGSFSSRSLRQPVTLHLQSGAEVNAGAQLIYFYSFPKPPPGMVLLKVWVFPSELALSETLTDMSRNFFPSDSRSCLAANQC